MSMKHYLVMVGLLVVMLFQLAQMTAMQEDFHPWYISYTTLLVLLSYFVFSPALLGTALLDKTGMVAQESQWVGLWIFNILWLLFLCYLVSRVSFSR